MKGFVLFLSSLLMLSGCAQVFEGNLFSTIDVPPPLDSKALANSSVDEIQSMMADDSFTDRLKEDPKALKAVQSVLQDAYTDPDSSDADKISAAQSYILATTWGSDVGDVSNAIFESDQLTNLSAGDGAGIADAVTALFGDMNQHDIEATLSHYLEIADALSAMQTAATSGVAIDASAFLPPGSGEMLQAALVAGAVAALVSAQSPPTAAGLAAAIAAGGSSVATTGGDLDDLSDALGASSPPDSSGSGNPYAYLYTLKNSLNIPGL